MKLSERVKFRQRIYLKLGRAIIEYYKVAGAIANRQAKLFQACAREARHLLQESVRAITGRTAGVRNKRRIVSQVIAELRSKDATLRWIATSTLVADYHIVLKHPIPATDIYEQIISPQ